MEERNIINLPEVRALVKELSVLNPLLSSYIQTKVLKFLKHDTYVVERQFYGLWLKGKLSLGLGSSLEKKMYKNYGWLGVYHLVPCGEGLSKRIQSGLDFLISSNLSKTASFKEVLYEMDRAKLGIKKITPKLLIPGLDYQLTSRVGAFEVWELLTPLAYEQEGSLMKNCLGRSEIPMWNIKIYSVRSIKDKKPVMNIKIKKDSNTVLEVKEKVNQELKQYDFLYQKIKIRLKLKEKLISDYFLSTF